MIAIPKELAVTMLHPAARDQLLAFMLSDPVPASAVINLPDGTKVTVHNRGNGHYEFVPGASGV